MDTMLWKGIAQWGTIKSKSKPRHQYSSETFYSSLPHVDGKWVSCEEIDLFQIPSFYNNSWQRPAQMSRRHLFPRQEMEWAETHKHSGKVTSQWWSWLKCCGSTLPSSWRAQAEELLEIMQLCSNLHYVCLLKGALAVVWSRTHFAELVYHLKDSVVSIRWWMTMTMTKSMEMWDQGCLGTERVWRRLMGAIWNSLCWLQMGQSFTKY